MATKSIDDRTTPSRIADRRVRKTRRQLRETLVSLVLEHGWDAVSVKDVCDRADIGRSTFYVHFVDKEDLLFSAFDELHGLLVERANEPPVPFAFAEALVAHASENVRLYRALLGRKSGHAMQRCFRETVARLIAGELEHLGVPPDGLGIVTQFLTGGFAEMLLAWLDRPSRIERGVLAAKFRDFALGAVRAAR